MGALGPIATLLAEIAGIIGLKVAEEPVERIRKLSLEIDQEWVKPEVDTGKIAALMKERKLAEEALKSLVMLNIARKG